MKKKLLIILMLLFCLGNIAPSYALTRQDVEHIMHTLLPSSKGITSAPLFAPRATTAVQEEQMPEPTVTIEEETLENDPYSYGTPQDYKNSAVDKPSTTEATPQQTEIQPSKPQPAQLTRQEVFLTCLNKMGWTPTLALLKKLAWFGEYANTSPSDIVLENIKPIPPTGLFAPGNEVFPDTDTTKLIEWARSCANYVKMEALLTHHGNLICIIKSGVPTPSGRVQDMWAKNVPLFIVYFVQDEKQNTAHIAIAEQMGADKLPLSAIASRTHGTEFAINGGYFGAGRGQIIGVLRASGNTLRRNFWRNRSGFAWNDNGEHIFFDARYTQSVTDNPVFDKYTEIFQAGPMLIFQGQVCPNTEDIHPDVLGKRHPRSFVAEQPDGTIVWGVIDGRSASHSVGMTIKELRNFCKRRNFVNALNLDGGGSSSVWWSGQTFSRPCNPMCSERKIPYAVLVFGTQTRHTDRHTETTPPQPPSLIDVAPTIPIPRQDDYNIRDTIEIHEE